MKTITTLKLTFLLFVCIFSSQAQETKVIRPETDTVLINFGKAGRLIIHVENQEDYKALKALDVNAIISKLGFFSDSTSQNGYMKDTTFTFHTSVSVDGKQIEKDIDVEVETIKVDIDSIEKNLDEAAQNIEKAKEEIKKYSFKIGEYKFDVQKGSEGKEEDSKVDIKKEKAEDRYYLKTRTYFNVHLGINNYFQDEHVPVSESTPYALDTWRSRYAAVNLVKKDKVSGPLFLTYGLELMFNNYMFTNDVTAAKDNGLITFPPILRDVKKTKLATTYLNVTLMPMLDFKGNFTIAAGGYVGYRVGSHTKIKYTSGNNIKEKDRSDFYLDDWRYGLRAQIGIKHVDFFANYDMNTLFRGDRGPKLNSFSVGIIL